MLPCLFVCLLQVVSHGYWEKDPNVKHILFQWFKTRRQYLELSWDGRMPVTKRTQTHDLSLHCLGAIKIHQFSLSEWYCLENPSSGFPVLPCCFSGMCQGQCSGFSLIIHSKYFPPSFPIQFWRWGTFSLMYHNIYNKIILVLLLKFFWAL